jgi:hypothetical protein
MSNYWGIKIVSGVMNILGALGVVAGVYSCSINGFGVAIGLGIIFGGIFLVAQGQLLSLAVGLAHDVSRIAEKVNSAPAS